jgi:hypothetical protein
VRWTKTAGAIDRLGQKIILSDDLILALMARRHCCIFNGVWMATKIKLSKSGDVEKVLCKFTSRQRGGGGGVD